MYRVVYLGGSSVLDKFIEKGTTALGRYKDNKFFVQINELSHFWSHGWHEVNPNYWSVR